MAASVMVAVGDVQHIIDEVAKKARALALGTQMGAIIERPAVERLQAAINRAEKEGARVLVDGRGRRPDHTEYTDGNWLGPTILDGVKPEHDSAQRELFGPVLSIVHVPTVSAAIALENASPYGNAASVFTQSGVVAQQVAEQAKAGMIGVNVGVPVPREPFSFGGIGESKFGHGDITGPSSLDFWSLQKKITRKWTARSDGSWMS
jgi:malonate-semialdehyde dehydrogenase (acetylating)/methylmalonate-semialdehyde dehydrogenase